MNVIIIIMCGELCVNVTTSRVYLSLCVYDCSSNYDTFMIVKCLDPAVFMFTLLYVH